MTDKQQTKIYVVTKGDYSDYHIITATTDKKLANEIAKKFSNGWGKAKVEIYKNAEIMLKPIYLVRFGLNGDVVEISSASTNEYMYEDINQCAFDHSKQVFVIVIADDADHAIKIANEKRAEFLARKAGVV